MISMVISGVYYDIGLAQMVIARHMYVIAVILIVAAIKLYQWAAAHWVQKTPDTTGRAPTYLQSIPPTTQSSAFTTFEERAISGECAHSEHVCCCSFFAT